MSVTKFKGASVELFGEIPVIGSLAPNFRLIDSDLNEVQLSDYREHNLILNVFPSIDTPVCAMSVRKFNQNADKMSNTKVLAISHDLPFALKRYCAAEGLKNIIPLSAFRYRQFGQDYGLLMKSGPLKGLLARAVIVINKERKVIYTELVPDIGDEPNYDSALDAVK